MALVYIGETREESQGLLALAWLDLGTNQQTEDGVHALSVSLSHFLLLSKSAFHMHKSFFLQIPHFKGHVSKD